MSLRLVFTDRGSYNGKHAKNCVYLNLWEYHQSANQSGFVGPDLGSKMFSKVITQV